MQTTAVGAEGSAPEATKQRAAGEDERMTEMERLFVGLLGNLENLAGRNAELGRRLAALEIARAAEAVTR